MPNNETMSLLNKAAKEVTQQDDHTAIRWMRYFFETLEIFAVAHGGRNSGEHILQIVNSMLASRLESGEWS